MVRFDDPLLEAALEEARRRHRDYNWVLDHIRSLGRVLPGGCFGPIVVAPGAPPAQQQVGQDARSGERQQQAAAQPAERMGTDAEVERRRRLLEEYKAATGASEYAILQAAGRDHSCHKPEFRQWKRGELPADSETAKSLERFLAAKRPPSKPKRKISPRGE